MGVASAERGPPRLFCRMQCVGLLHARQTFRMLQTPGGRSWWQRHAVSFNPGFQDFVNAALRDSQRDSD